MIFVVKSLQLITALHLTYFTSLVDNIVTLDWEAIALLHLIQTWNVYQIKRQEVWIKWGKDWSCRITKLVTVQKKLDVNSMNFRVYVVLYFFSWDSLLRKVHTGGTNSITKNWLISCNGQYLKTRSDVLNQTNFDTICTSSFWVILKSSCF